MKKLQFDCQQCEKKVEFSLENFNIKCPHCSQEYQLNDPKLKNQLHKFVTLCETIKNSEEILSETHVGVDVGENHVEIPYKLLLARLNTTLNIKLGDRPLKIQFRMENIGAV